MPRGMPSLGDPLMRVSVDTRGDAHIPLDDIGREVQQYATPLAQEVAALTARMRALEQLARYVDSRAERLHGDMTQLEKAVVALPPPTPADAILTPLREVDFPALLAGLSTFEQRWGDVIRQLSVAQDAMDTRLMQIENVERDIAVTLHNVRDMCISIEESERVRACAREAHPVLSRIRRWLGGE